MLIFDGLHIFGGSVCRLRVISCDSSKAPRVVLATNLEDAPGASIVNGFETLVETVVSQFGEQATRWILHFPARTRNVVSGKPTWTEATLADGPDATPEWHQISTRDAEAITGLDLSTPGVEPTTIAALSRDAELWRNLALTPEPERLPAECFAVVPVAALPFAHNPFRCAHHQRFVDLKKLYNEPNKETVVGAHWHLTLTAVDFERCRFHECDWREVAEASVELFEGLVRTATRDDLMEACSGQRLAAPELEALTSIFADPIHWVPGSPSVVNGQHRMCALRAAGAARCVVDTGGRHLDRSTPVLTVEAAASSALASYWVGCTANSSVR